MTPIQIGPTFIFKKSFLDIYSKDESAEEKCLNQKLMAFTAFMGAFIASKAVNVYIHSVNTAIIAQTLAKIAGLSFKQTQELKVATILHDIGKLYVPSGIINKPGILSPLEYEYVKLHVNFGVQAIEFFWDVFCNSMPKKKKKTNNSKFPSNILKTILCHHEKCNGSGYPNGLTASEIPLSAKILTIADIVESLSSLRPYRMKLLTLKEIQEEIEKETDKLDKTLLQKTVSILPTLHTQIQQNTTNFQKNLPFLQQNEYLHVAVSTH